MKGLNRKQMKSALLWLFVSSFLKDFLTLNETRSLYVWGSRRGGRPCPWICWLLFQIPELTRNRRSCLSSIIWITMSRKCLEKYNVKIIDPISYFQSKKNSQTLINLEEKREANEKISSSFSLNLESAILVLYFHCSESHT